MKSSLLVILTLVLVIIVDAHQQTFLKPLKRQGGYNYNPFPASIKFGLIVRAGNGTSPDPAQACTGVTSKSVWYFDPTRNDFRLDCTYPQPDNEQQCPWMFSLPHNIWHFPKQGIRTTGYEYHYDPTPDPKPYCESDVVTGSPNDLGMGAFGSQYPFHFPANSTFSGLQPCPTGGNKSGQNCETWTTPTLSELPYIATWYVTLAGLLQPDGSIIEVSVPDRLLMNINSGYGDVPLCLDFFDVVPVTPSEDDFVAPAYCGNSQPGFQKSVMNLVKKVVSTQNKKIWNARSLRNPHNRV